jgi:transcriptional regulator with XRE-family HTH domain
MSNFSENLSFLVSQETKTKTEIAAELDISRTSFGRFLSGKRRPNQARIAHIAAWFKIQDVGTLNLPPKEFLEHHAGRLVKSTLRLLSFRTTTSSRSTLLEASKKYSGQYNLYYRRPKAAPNAAIIVSFVAIEQVTDEGIGVIIKNPFIDSNGAKSVFEYRGFLFPLDGFLYAITEQESANYELFSLILRKTLTPKVTTLKGIITGIAVNDQKTVIGARAVVLERRAKQFQDWTEAFDPKDFSYVSEGKVPEVVRKNLLAQSIDIE